MCGDGAADPDEACDDGNATSGDGCSATCSIEVPDPSAVCGNGTRENNELCDDGNTIDNDGCSATCAIEHRCGDHTVDAGEECDDGNTKNGDGCSSTCDVEVTPACGLVPQSGCTGGTPACDITNDGDTECRAVTSLGTSNSHCTTATACKAGYTCAHDPSAGEGWCTRFCEDDGDCLGTGSRCVVSFEGNSGPLPAQGCSNACDPYGQTGCPTGMGCLPNESNEGDYTDCAYMDGKADYATCSSSLQCSEGSICAPDYNNVKRCQPICIVGSNTCDYPGHCFGFTAPLVIGTVEYGVCE